jgi:transposase
VGIDASTLEANAALRSIVRRDTGESYEGFLDGLAKASGIATPSREDRARVDKKRPKKGSNDDWTNPNDPDAKITKMKDGRTHLGHKAEHAVDLDSGALLAVTVQPADRGDSESVYETLLEACDHVKEALPEADGIEAVVLDKGYHCNAVLTTLSAVGIRSYASEPRRGRRRWKGKAAEQQAVYGNRRRVQGKRGKELLARRGELVERTFAHTLVTGRMRRAHLRGHDNIAKRYLVHVAAANLGLLMRSLIGVGTPKGLAGRLAAVYCRLKAHWSVSRRPRLLMERFGQVAGLLTAHESHRSDILQAA